MVHKICLSDTESVNRLNKIACDQLFDISISDEFSIVDAKSLIALYPYVGKEVYIVVEDSIGEKTFKNLIKRMGF